MKRSTAQRTTLAALAVDAASQSGLDAVSLRSIAKQAGCSTAVIFQNFGGKAELIAEATDVAANQDAAFHDDLLAQSNGLIRNHVAFSDFLCAYIEMRAAAPQARFLSELHIKLSQNDGCRAILHRWREMRISFWRRVLASFDFGDRLAPIVADYSLMEENYVYPLQHQFRFQLLKRESVRALTSACFNGGVLSETTNGVNQILQWKSYEAQRLSDHNRVGMAKQMLTHAIEIIRHDGIGALNQRTLARKANVSSSMIAYHFKDMKTFTNEAIWRALVKELPSEFDTNKMVALPATIAEWVEFLDKTLRIDGFYVSYSRMTCETALLACSDRSLVPLMTYLREIDGWGTYRLSCNIPSTAAYVKPEHAAAFAVWLKAEALLRHSGLASDDGDAARRIENAMSVIFPIKS